MGTAARFVTALGGVALIVFALVLLGRPIIQTIAASESTDFPGGAAGLVVLWLLVGSLPFGGGVLLIRRAVRGGSSGQAIDDRLQGLPESRTPAPPPPAADVVASAPIQIEATTPVQPPQATRDTESAPPQRARRTWLAMLGLTIAVCVLLFDAIILLGAFSDDSLSQGANAVILVVVLLLSALPLLGGLRLAHVGDPGMGRRFITDLGTWTGQLRRPTSLVGSSAGLAFVTAIVSVPAMVIARDAALYIGPFALTFFSVIDPLANVLRQRSWWTGAFVSAASWFVLFLVTAVTAGGVSGQPDVVLLFILPVMAYPAAMALSGLIRFLQWQGRQ